MQEGRGNVEIGVWSNTTLSGSLQRGRGRVGRGRHSCQSQHQVNAARSAARPLLKGKNFRVDEECQLTRSVLAILQDPIVGNQQKSSSF